MSTSEYHFIEDMRKKREIIEKLKPPLKEILDEYGIDYLVGFYISAIASYLRVRGIDEMAAQFSENTELVIRIEKVKKEGV